MLGVKSADEFGFSFGEIKRRAVRLCNRRYEVTHETDDLRKNVPAGNKGQEPEGALLMLEDFVKVDRTRQEKNADDGKRERNFITDHLRGAAQAAQQRVLAIGRPSGERHAINANRSDREKE